MDISQGLGSGAAYSSTEEIRVIELSINNETHRKAALVLMGFTLVLAPPWIFISIFYSAWKTERVPTWMSESILWAWVGDTIIASSRSMLQAFRRRQLSWAGTAWLQSCYRCSFHNEGSGTQCMLVYLCKESMGTFSFPIFLLSLAPIWNTAGNSCERGPKPNWTCSRAWMLWVYYYSCCFLFLAMQMASFSDGIH